MKPQYTEYFNFIEEIETQDTTGVSLIEFKLPDDEEILNEWARCFLSNYVSDEDIDRMCESYGMGREKYIQDIKLPDRSSLGNATRSGDFCEILVADYAEFVLDYIVPRTRYDRKTNRNSSTQGTDLIGYKLDENQNHKDEMIVFEIKAQASNSRPKNKLQEAVNDSTKDIKRIATSLNASAQRLLDRGDTEKANIVMRFQNKTDRPYIRKYSAAAVHSEFSFSKKLIREVTTEGHDSAVINLVVIYSEDLMNTIHDIYRRACKC